MSPAGFGLGGSLVDRKSAVAGDWAVVAERARTVVSAVSAWRAGGR